MKLIVAGGRNYQMTREDKRKLMSIEGVTMVVSGGATGVDTTGIDYALAYKLPYAVFPADFNGLGKKAGPLRNKAMAQFADACALFPGGKGTDSMYREAMAAGLKVFDWRLPTEASEV
jgi:predicted Rossmann-fold nucleotide-binding protein